MEGHRDIAELMLHLGATRLDRAMRLAAEYGHSDIVDLISQRNKRRRIS